MSARVKKHLPLYKWLCHSNPKSTRAVLQVADKDVIDGLCECSYNVLKGNVPLKPEQKRRLKRHKQVLRELSYGRGKSLKRKRQLLQRGGFLGALMSPLIGILGSLLLK